MCQWTRPSLVQIMAWCQPGNKPLSEPLLVYCNWTLRNKPQWNFNQISYIFIQESTSGIHRQNNRWWIFKWVAVTWLDTLRLRQNGRHFADDTFKRIFLNENVRISIEISLKFVPKGPFNNIPALVQIMAWHWSGDKPLSEPMMVSLLTHICVTQPQWVKERSSTK